MGRRLIALAAADPRLTLAAAIDSPNCPRLGDDAGTLAGIEPLGVKLSSSLDTAVDVAIDFSLPDAAERIIELCRHKKIPLVEATTGLDEPRLKKLHAASREIPIIHSPNMSLAVNLTMKLAQSAARALKDRDADVEIIERHHRFKEDAPSGTALKFGRLISAAMGLTAETHGRQGRPGKRPHDEIGYHAVRVGDDPGQHTIIFGCLGESIELTVRATNRDCYALGALAAAKFLAGKPPGLYDMDAVLGL
jgi:4-hydroxy-tetrahydrodipicolinate reductase